MAGTKEGAAKARAKRLAKEQEVNLPIEISYGIFKDPDTNKWGYITYEVQGNKVVKKTKSTTMGARGIAALKVQQIIKRMKPNAYSPTDQGV